MIVLIGGTGFIGKHVCVRIHAAGAEATVVSRSPDVDFLKRHAPSVAALPSDELGGVRGRDLIERATAVVYMAGQSVPATFALEPWREVPSNVEPALRLFDHASRINAAARYVLLSSGGTIYGGSHDRPITEASPLQPISGYGLGKVLIEEGWTFFGRTRGARFSILRLSNPIGRWHTGALQGLVPITLRAIRDGRPVHIYGDGMQTRDYVHADDVADAVWRACADDGLSDRVWNVGSGVGIGTLDMIKRIEAAIARKADIAFEPGRAIDVPYVVLDCSRIRQDLGWYAKRDIEEAIQEIWSRDLSQADAPLAHSAR